MTVPIEPFVHATIDTQQQAQIPATVLPDGTEIRQRDARYEAILIVESDHPRTAKHEAVSRVEAFLSLIAATNDGFRAVPEGLTAQLVDTVGMGDVAFAEDHLSLVKTKANLDTEAAALGRLATVTAGVRGALELNHLLVTTDRPLSRWLLAAIGLECLAVARTGRQEMIRDRFDKPMRRELRKRVGEVLQGFGLEEAEQGRMLQRMLETTTAPVARHIGKFLDSIGIRDVDVDELSSWWLTRGSIAHGDPVAIDQGALNRLIATFQSALRRELGMESTEVDPGLPTS